MTGRSAASAPQPVPVHMVEERDKHGREVALWSRGRLLGKGGFAKCYEAVHQKTGESIAMKIIDKKTLEKPKTLRKLQSEIRIHRSISHPNIVGFQRYFEDSGAVYLLLELCRGQTLMEQSKRRGVFTEPEVSFLLSQLLDAVSHMHKHRIIHRDLKLNNIMLTTGWQVKVGDFGLATQVLFEGERKRTVCGTPNYIAPEVLSGSPNGHSYEVDLWSVGVIVYALLVGRPPFETSDLTRTYRRIKQVQYSFPSECAAAPEGKELVRSLLQADPQHRPSIDALYSSAFFRRFPKPPEVPETLLAAPQKRESRDPHRARTPLGRVDPNRGAAQYRGSPRHRHAVDPNAACTQARTGRQQSRPPASRGTCPAPPRRTGSVGCNRRPADDIREPLLAPSPRSGSSRRLRSPSPLGRGPSAALADRAFTRRLLASESPGHCALTPRAEWPRRHSPASMSAPRPPPATARGPSSSTPRRHYAPERAEAYRVVECPREVSDSPPSSSGSDRNGAQHDGAAAPSPAPRVAGFRDAAPSSRRGSGSVREPPSTARTSSSQRYGVTPEMRSPSLPPYAPSQSPEATSQRRLCAHSDAPSPAPAPRLSPQCQQTPEARVVDRDDADLTEMRDHIERLSDGPPAVAPPPPIADRISYEAHNRVVQYADFSARYGLAFRTADGTVGVHFNDKTNMIWDRDTGDLEYTSRVKVPGPNGGTVSTDERRMMHIDDFPQALTKKVTLTRYFRNYLAKGRGKEPREGSPPVITCSRWHRVSEHNPGQERLYVKRWLRTELAIVFRLSNRMVQVCFHDGAEIMLSAEAQWLTHIDTNGVRDSFQLEILAAQGGARDEVAERLRYTKELIGKLLSQPRGSG